jgi:hypothetical protein
LDTEGREGEAAVCPETAEAGGAVSGGQPDVIPESSESRPDPKERFENGDDSVGYDELTDTYYDTETGEVLQSILHLPSDLSDAEVVELANRLGDKLEFANARLAGLMAQRDAHYERIDALYAARIRQAEKAIDYLKTNLWYRDPIEAMAKSVRANTKKQSGVIGRLRFKFKGSAAWWEITDKPRALIHLAAEIPDAIQVTREILKSKIPAGAEVHGMVRHPAGEKETFEIQ